VNFDELLQKAKAGDEAAIIEITEMHKPFILKESIVDGLPDEDLYQEIWLTLLNCIRKINL
jgi:hypothetical protein